MRRLLDEPGNSGSAAFADLWPLDLLRSVSPYQTTAGRKQRVWMGLAHPVDRRPRVAFRRLVFVGILAVFGGATAIASAALGHWPAWATRAYERLLPRSSPVAAVTEPVSAPGKARRAFRLMANNDEVPAAEAATPTEQAPAPVIEVASSRVATQRTDGERREHTRARRVLPQAAMVAAVEEETAPVLAAMRALRRDRNPVRARALLDTYLKEHPTGALAEEALAMSIEAAVAHHDTDARALAERYAQSYPNGPFRVLAKRTLTVPPMH